jgi:LmbE family N-acetylglucosaminyl deacetylase
MRWAPTREFGDDVGLDLDSIRGIATMPNTQVHVGDYWDSKVAALRRCRSQEDALWGADVIGHMTGRTEYFHQGYPPGPEGAMVDGLWS